MDAITEKRAFSVNGFLMLLIVLVIFLLAGYLILNSMLISSIVLLIFGFISLGGFLVLQPNNSAVLILFGKYIGTIKDSGFWWVNPFAFKKKISLRIHNFNSEKIKVNDLHGNPIEIAAVIVWRVVDSARAIFDVQNYEQFVSIQSETAIRAVASQYSYDSNENDKMSLVGNQHEIAEELKKFTQSRLEIAGIEIIETRLSYLAYAPEIAQAMLRRQQAQAVVAARTKIVEGAVGMVDMALKALSEQHIVELDEEKKATMVNNLMVALVSEVQAQPVINAGSLY
ncbi:SPFH domain-containing protein [Stygiobacter electus]|uniref:SPFH domain-containing protein n=1 Tax=Stygiobacter electus TaxID=3032292 RepID=A0AAE3P1U6_9BACT|nr:SPFH domain-containing protein [Stygiobacter electus]MDF1612824.1 SPFH domain-containing protein [Stygiobacter electus]